MPVFSTPASEVTGSDLSSPGPILIIITDARAAKYRI